MSSQPSADFEGAISVAENQRARYHRGLCLSLNKANLSRQTCQIPWFGCVDGQLVVSGGRWDGGGGRWEPPYFDG